MKTVGIILDFDDTLCDDSTNGFLKWSGIDEKKFWQETQDLIQKGYDPVLSYMNLMLNYAAQKKYQQVFLKDNFIRYSQELKFYSGVEFFFSHLKQYVKKIDEKVVLKFFLISSGLEMIVSNTNISDQFESIFCSAFDYNRFSKIKSIKRAISFTDKTRYVFAISKGVSAKDSIMNPHLINEKIPYDKIDIPFSRLIYIGDGYSDIPCFALIKHFKGYGIGVYKKYKMKTANNLKKDQRVAFISDVNFSKTGNLIKHIKSHLDSILKRR